MVENLGSRGIEFEATVDAVGSALGVGTIPARPQVESAALPSSRSHNRRHVVRRALVTADGFALFATYLLAAVIRGSQSVDQFGTVFAFVALILVWFAGAAIRGLYDHDTHRPDHPTLDELGSIVQIITCGIWIAALSLWLANGAVDIPTLLLLWLGALGLVTLGRVFARVAVHRHRSFTQNTVIVGAGDVGQLVARKLLQHPEFGFRFVGFVDGEPREMRGDLDGMPIFGGPSEIARIVQQEGVGRVIVAFSNDRHDLLLDLIRSLRGLDVEIDLVPRLFEEVGPIAGIHLVEGFPLVGLSTARPSRLGRYAKRAIDLVVAGSILTLTAPLFAWIVWRVRKSSPGPAFFRQTRLGEGQKSFTLLKFRTMTVDTDDAPHREYIRAIMDEGAVAGANNLYKLDRSSNVTRFGGWLRRTSLDELPQLINVVRGDMSLVGPRPCLSYETELFEPHHFGRFLVPAGMTGLWQVAARAHATMKEALDLDVTYARAWSLRLDLQLLARTPLALLRGGGTT